MKDLRERALELHTKTPGKLSIESTVPLRSADDLSLAYSPGVAEPCKEIHSDSEKIYDYTMKGNLVAVVSNGTSVLGLGNIGAAASMPVMEGKAVLFKAFAGIDAFPVCLDVSDPDELIETVKRMEPTFGGINLEDISAPDCFYIEERLKKEMNIPVFHDDQHGTAIVTAAGLINSLKLVKKNMNEIKVVVNGAGSAGVAIVKILIELGIENIIMCDSKGAIYKGRSFGMNPMKEEIANNTNRQLESGELKDVIQGADVFVGVSVAGALTPEMIKTMERDPIILAMANPIPEIMPVEAKKAGAKVIGTGRSDFPNQVNNVLAFPGVFRGALDTHAKEINEEMKLAAVYAIAKIVQENELTEEHVIPSTLDPRVAPAVADAVAEAAVKTGVARKNPSKEKVDAMG